MTSLQRKAWALAGLASIVAMGFGTSLGWYGRPLQSTMFGSGDPPWFGPPPSLLVFCAWVWSTWYCERLGSVMGRR